MRLIASKAFRERSSAMRILLLAIIATIVHRLHQPAGYSFARARLIGACH